MTSGARARAAGELALTHAGDVRQRCVGQGQRGGAGADLGLSSLFWLPDVPTALLLRCLLGVELFRLEKTLRFLEPKVLTGLAELQPCRATSGFSFPGCEDLFLCRIRTLCSSRCTRNRSGSRDNEAVGELKF